MSAALERLTREAREEVARPREPKVDWSAVEAKLFERVEREATARNVIRKEWPRKVWAPVAAALAVAASVALVWGRGQSSPLGAPAAEATRSDSMGALAWRTWQGPLLVGGKEADQGTTLALGDTIESLGGARATFARSRNEAVAVRWAIEPQSRAKVEHAGGALVLALETGAVEAQVTPVSQGEAFAVDVDGTRVAVHGTHLRVARTAGSVVVDLSEGVVSIGPPPRVGSTYGDVVAAPAHIEFSVGSPHATLRIDHTPSSVRPPVSLDEPVAAAANRPANPAVIMGPPPLPLVTQPPPPAISPKPEPSAQANAALPPPDPHADATVARAVEGCIRARPQAEDVTLTVTSTLTFTVGDDGFAHGAAVFSPPLHADVQNCSTATIFKVRFAQPGPVSIPIRVTR